jgi:hypothetical protein
VPVKQEEGDDYIKSSTTMEVRVVKIESEDGTLIFLEFKKPDEEEFNLLHDLECASRPSSSGVGFDQKAGKTIPISYDMGWEVKDEIPDESDHAAIREAMHKEIRATLNEEEE